MIQDNKYGENYLMFFKIREFFIHQRAPRFTWNSRQKYQAQRLARLDKFNTLMISKLDTNQMAKFIHDYHIGLDHSLVQIKLYIESKEVRKYAFKLNVTYLRKEITKKSRGKYKSLLKKTPFFHILRLQSRIYRKLSKRKLINIKERNLKLGPNQK